MALPNWLSFGTRTQPTLDLAMEGTIEQMVMDRAEEYAEKYWEKFLDLADASNAAFVKACKKHLRYIPTDADRVVTRTWLLAQVARRLKVVTISELQFLLRPRSRSNPPMSDLYEQMHGDADAARQHGIIEQLDKARWDAVEQRIAHPSFAMTSTRAAEAALRIQENSLQRESEWQKELLSVLSTLEDDGLLRDPLATRVAWFMEQIALIDILWDVDRRGVPLSYFESLCPGGPSLSGRKVMADWVDDHVEPMVDEIFKYATHKIADAVTLIRKTTRLKKSDERGIHFLVVGAFYYETVNEIVRQAGLGQNPESMRLRYLDT